MLSVVLCVSLYCCLPYGRRSTCTGIHRVERRKQTGKITEYRPTGTTSEVRNLSTVNFRAVPKPTNPTGSNSDRYPLSSNHKIGSGTCPSVLPRSPLAISAPAVLVTYMYCMVLHTSLHSLITGNLSLFLLLPLHHFFSSFSCLSSSVSPSPFTTLSSLPLSLPTCQIRLQSSHPVLTIPRFNPPTVRRFHLRIQLQQDGREGRQRTSHQLWKKRSRKKIFELARNQ